MSHQWNNGGYPPSQAAGPHPATTTRASAAADTQATAAATTAPACTNPTRGDHHLFLTITILTLTRRQTAGPRSSARAWIPITAATVAAAADTTCQALPGATIRAHPHQ